MSRNLISITLLVVLTRVACADVIVDLRPDAAAPYEPGQVVTVEVYFVDDGTGHPITGSDILPRGFQIDFTDTDAGIGLPSDMTLINPGGSNTLFTALPRPAVIFAPPGFGQPWVIPAGGEQLIGELDVTVNEPGWLRVLNANSDNPNFGAWLQFGYGLTDDDPVITWRAYTGEITGGALFLPEPGVLTLLAVGGLAVMRRRRAAA